VNDDMLVASTYWLYPDAPRLGLGTGGCRRAGADPSAMEIIENSSYQRLLLMFRGDLRTDELRPRAAASARPTQPVPAPIDDVTTGYGLGAWHWCNGERTTAEAIWRQTLATGNWPAFGYIAAEAELARGKQ
jgi:hypothetical protein